MTVGEGTVDSGGVKLHYLDWGTDGPPLILIHATGFLARLWQPIAEQLASRYRVIAYDQRGHGDSDKPQNGYVFETFAADLQALIEGLGLERPIAAGHSAGASTIAVHAALYPGVISRAVLIEPILPERASLDGESNARAEAARKRRAVWSSTDEMFESYGSRPPFDTWREDLLHVYVEEGTRQREDGQVELKCPPELEAKYYEAVRLAGFWPLLPKVQCPTLFVWGADNDLRSRMGEGLENEVPNSHTVSIPDTTHFLVMEKPDELAALLTKDSLFVANLAQASRS
jgi:pimeloyl-ACP methyl ester carboxylesterase